MCSEEEKKNQINRFLVQYTFEYCVLGRHEGPTWKCLVVQNNGLIDDDTMSIKF